MLLPDDQTIISTLKKHSAYVTQNRIAVLKVLYENRGSISVSRIRKMSAIELDRVSVYRTLQFFLEKGLIIIVPNSKGNPHYILTDFLKGKPGYSPDHPLVYFVCNRCGFTEMIDQSIQFNFNRPDQHQIKKCYIVLEGSCAKCI